MNSRIGVIVKICITCDGAYCLYRGWNHQILTFPAFCSSSHRHINHPWSMIQEEMTPGYLLQLFFSMITTNKLTNNKDTGVSALLFDSDFVEFTKITETGSAIPYPDGIYLRTKAKDWCRWQIRWKRTGHWLQSPSAWTKLAQLPPPPYEKAKCILAIFNSVWVGHLIIKAKNIWTGKFSVFMKFQITVIFGWFPLKLFIKGILKYKLQEKI